VMVHQSHSTNGMHGECAWSLWMDLHFVRIAQTEAEYTLIAALPQRGALERAVDIP